MNKEDLNTQNSENIVNEYSDLLDCSTIKIYEQLNKNDKFFPAIQGSNEATWNQKWLENMSGYADKYKAAVCALSRTISDNQESDIIKPKDCLAYPIMFLARHALELRLKALISALVNNINKKKISSHNLDKLWKLFDLYYTGTKQDDQYIKAAQLINELSNFDKNSDTFRYPYHIDNTPTSEREFIDIDTFIKTFFKLNQFLEGLEDELNEN